MKKHKGILAIIKEEIANKPPFIPTEPITSLGVLNGVLANMPKLKSSGLPNPFAGSLKTGSF